MHNLTKLKSEKDLLIINALSALLIIAVILVPDSPVRTVLGLPFVLFFPGYTLICAFFSSKTDLSGIERLSLSMGLSLAVVPLVGLGLNYSPWGIRLAPIIASLFAFTLLMSLLSFYRRAKLPPEQKFAITMSIKLPKWSMTHRSDKLFIVGILIAIVLVGSLTAYLASTPKIGERFTEFYMLGSNGKLADYPTNLTLGENSTVTLGITNHEYQNVTYKIVISLDNSTIQTSNNITLSNENTWEQNYTFTPEKTGDKINLEFELYREGLDTPYRTLQLWITVRP